MTSLFLSVFFIAEFGNLTYTEVKLDFCYR